MGFRIGFSKKIGGINVGVSKYIGGKKRVVKRKVVKKAPVNKPPKKPMTKKEKLITLGFIVGGLAFILLMSALFGEETEVSSVDSSTQLTSTQPTPTKEYTSEDLLLAFDDEETGESLIGETIQVTGELKYDPTDSKITLETTGKNLDGFIYCEMSEYSEDFSNLKEDECVVIVGTIEKEVAHVYMVDCWYIGKAEESNDQESSTSNENLSAEGNSLVQYGTTDDMNVIVAKAEEDAATAIEETINEALNWLNDNNSHLFDSQENIEQTMYYGNLLDYYYKDTDEDLAYLGFKAFETVKYVYRGVDSVLDDVTHNNLMDLKDLLESYLN